MKPYRILLLILTGSIILLSGTVSGQKIKKANQAAMYYQYADIIPMLEAVIEKDNKHKVPAMELLAKSYLYMNNMEKAAEWYAQVVENEDIEPESHYYYAQVLRTLGRYEEAKDQFLRYDSLAPDDPRGKIYASYCDSIRIWKEQESSASVANAGKLNSSYADFSPVFYREGLIITSERPGGESGEEIYPWTGKPYLDLFYAEAKKDTLDAEIKYGPLSPFSRVLNQPYHDGPVTFSEAGDTVFLTRTIDERLKKNKKEDVRTHILKIFYSIYKDDAWIEPLPFYLNSHLYSVGHPALSENGDLLYFVSDMPGGFGETDIYVCHKEVEGWGPAINLGPMVNTFGREMFPYAKDSLLYFSSTGHMGYGGLDLFKSQRINDTLWTRPENLMAPINSSYDDFGVVFNPDQTLGYFSSNRPGGKGSDDIYTFEQIEPEPPVIMAGYVADCAKDVTLSGMVRDKQTLQPLAGATVFALNKKMNTVVVSKTDDAGRYSFLVDAKTTYVVKGMKDSYMSDCYSMVAANRPQLGRDLLLDKFEVNKVFQLENIYYNLDKWNIRPDAATELDKLVMVMKENPIKIELSSHTDSRASDEYNQRLSQQRAESAVQYLISKGIMPDRLIAMGYGESKLVNRCADGVPCSEKEHQQNRRTEFKVTEITKQPTSLFKPLESFSTGEILQLNQFDAGFFANCDYYTGDQLAIDEFPEACTKPLAHATVFVLNIQTGKVNILKTDQEGRYQMEVEPDGEYVVKARKEGYLGDCLTTEVSKESLLNEDLRLTKYEIEQVFEVENIYYDLDKWDIRADAEPSLNELVRIMKENPITIELGSHTDCRASDRYNMELSQKRAESAVRYIIFQGVDPSRITARGYGESKLINHCSDGVPCTEKEHQMNRRTEFRITGIQTGETSAMESLDRFQDGAVFDRSYFAAGYFDECPMRIPLAVGAEVTDKRIWAEFARAFQPLPTTMPIAASKEVVKPAQPASATVVEKQTAVTLGWYTVQIAAGSKPMDKSYFKGITGVRRCLGKDGLYRYTVGEFQTQQEANAYKSQIRNQGYPDAFVVKIDENRTDCQ